MKKNVKKKQNHEKLVRKEEKKRCSITTTTITNNDWATPTTTNDLNDLYTFRFFFSVIFLIFLFLCSGVYAHLCVCFVFFLFFSRNVHIFHVILGIFMGILILDQKNARFTLVKCRKHNNNSNSSTSCETKTNDAVLLCRLCIAGSLFN